MHFKEDDFQFRFDTKMKRLLKTDAIGIFVFPSIHAGSEVEQPPSKREKKMVNFIVSLYVWNFSVSVQCRISSFSPISWRNKCAVNWTVLLLHFSLQLVRSAHARLKTLEESETSVSHSVLSPCEVPTTSSQEVRWFIIGALKLSVTKRSSYRWSAVRWSTGSVDFIGKYYFRAERLKFYKSRM